LVVAFIPRTFRVYKHVVRCADANCAELELNDLPQRLGGVIREISTTIRYIDLTPRLVAEARKGRLLYLPDDAHWTAEGHRLAAEVIAETVGPLLRAR
jgi:hypothetical protein